MIRRRHHLRNILGAYSARCRHLLPGASHRLTSGSRVAPFFIVSAGRSGTTLLRRILCTADGIHIPAETWLEPVIRLYMKNAALHWRHLVVLVLGYIEFRREFADYSLKPLAERARKLPRQKRTLADLLDLLYRYDAEMHQITCTRWGDKTPGNFACLDEILRMFPDARFVHLYRDGCDVVASMVRKGLAASFTDAAHAWIDSIETCASFRNDYPERMMDVRYETLVSQPEITLKSICRFLDIQYLDEMSTHSHEHLDSVQPEIQSVYHENLDKPINTGLIGRGRSMSNASNFNGIANLLDPQLKALGYEPCHVLKYDP